MRLITIFLLFLPCSFSFDIVAETVKRVSLKSTIGACDNFYRHACPFNSIPLKEHFENLTAQLTVESLKEPSNQYEILAKFPFNISYTRDLAALYFERCQKNEDTGPLLKYFESLFTYRGRGLKESCQGGTFCATQLIHENDCTRGRALLEQNFDQLEELYAKLMNLDALEYGLSGRQPPQNTTKLYDMLLVRLTSIERRRDIVINVNTMKQPDIANGVKFINDLLQDAKVILIDWIKETPWVVKNRGVDFITSLIDQLKLSKDFDEIAEKMSQSLKTIEKKYVQCKKDINSYDIYGIVICTLYAYEDFEMPHKVLMPFGDDHNAGNMHPHLNFGHAYYWAVSQIETMAGKIGFLGTVLGHEIGHTIIEDFGNPFPISIPFFSKNVTDCIQNTFQNTCDKFVEASCAVVSSQVDENGSDIIGRELAYQLFRNHYGDNYNKIHEPLNVTNEQLFFYATSIFFCDGNYSYQSFDRARTALDVHSANNIRVNVFAQQAEFKNAFKCHAGQPMVDVIKEECHIYGEKAPEIKRL